MLAEQGNYAQAQRMKTISDHLEEKERNAMNTNFSGSCERKELNLRKRQQVEFEGLKSRIEIKRRNMISKRKHDCQRLLNRNQFIQRSHKTKHVSFPQYCLSSTQLNCLTSWAHSNSSSMSFKAIHFYNMTSPGTNLSLILDFLMSRQMSDISCVYHMLVDYDM